MTRTVVRGRAPGPIRRMFEAVRDAVQLGIETTREGVAASSVHESIEELFAERGFENRTVRGKRFGFLHSTGHGIGLDLHEPPLLGPRKGRLSSGNVVTIEPGLYDPASGGVRIEELVLVRKRDCRRLTRFPIELELF